MRTDCSSRNVGRQDWVTMALNFKDGRAVVGDRTRKDLVLRINWEHGVMATMVEDVMVDISVWSEDSNPRINVGDVTMIGVVGYVIPNK